MFEMSYFFDKNFNTEACYFEIFVEKLPELLAPIVMEILALRTIFFYRLLHVVRNDRLE